MRTPEDEAWDEIERKQNTSQKRAIDDDTMVYRNELLEEVALDRKSTRLNSSHMSESRMPSSA